MADYDIAGAFAEIEDELISSMLRNFKRHRAEETKLGYNWTQWQAEQLKALEIYRKENREKFSKRFTSINGKVREMLRKARMSGNAAQEALILQNIKDGFRMPKKPPASSSARFFKLNDRKLDALIKSTVNDLEKAEHATLRRANDQYRKAIFNAQVYANSGAATYEKAVDMALESFKRAGLNSIEYKNGARHTLSDYADMAIRTANKRAYLAGEGEKRAEWGLSLVVINKRQGGCPRCARFIGKVFIDDVWSGGKKSDGKYPLLSSAIDGGLYHPRCKDSHSTYYEGITKLEPLSREELRQLEEQEELEQQESYYKNQDEKNQRIADYCLDKDNKEAFSQRAREAEEKAEEVREKIEEKTEETVEKSGESGIIKETVVDGKNVAGEWEPRQGFDSLIDDIIDYQGFNGNPKVIYDQTQFDQAVQDNHFLGERTLRASDQELLKRYEDQLRVQNGEDYFYVNCGVGGAQHGQGMYCAADYSKGKTSFANFEHEIWEYGSNQATDESFSSTSWLTMDPTAKILEIPKKSKTSEYIPALYQQEYMIKHAGDQIDDVTEYIKKCEAVDNLTFSESEEFIDKAYDERNQSYQKVKSLAQEAMEATTYKPEGAKYSIPKDPGVLAAELGYDAINATGHGATGSYTVVLNRTKLIIYGGEKYVYG